MTNKSFSAQVASFVFATQQRLEAVVKSSTLDVINVMQETVAKGGNMPVDTGFLRSSLEVNFSGPVSLSRSGGTGSYSFSISSVEAAVSSYVAGKTIYATYGANYAGHVNYGTSGRAGRQFVGLAAQRWPSIVAANVRKLKYQITPR